MAALFNRVFGGAGGDEADGGFLAVIHDGRRTGFADGIELARKTIDIVNIIVFALGVGSLLIVAAAAGEVSAGGVIGGGKRAIADSIAVHILISCESAQA